MSRDVADRHPVTTWLAILGIGEDGALGPEAERLLEEATLVVGGARHLALAGARVRGRAMPWPQPMLNGVSALLAHRPGRAAVLASGDPMWFGVGTTLLRHVPGAEIRTVPAVSCFALAAARLGWALDGVACLSCCGRPVAALRPHVQEGRRLFVLSGDAGTPAEVAERLVAWGFGGSVVHVLEALGGPLERIRAGVPEAMPEGIGVLNMLGIEVRGGLGLALTPGLEDGLFEHDGQITKREVRALTLSALGPRPGEMLWDVGCGSGSVGIEWMLRDASCRAVGLEAQADRAARARANAVALGVPGLVVVEGRAPDVLVTLGAEFEAPDAVFLGGGAQRAGVIEAAWAALRPGGRLVANAVVLATEVALVAAQARFGGSLLRVGLERLDRVGGMAAYRPAMTVTQWTVTK